MSKGDSYIFSGTKGQLVQIISNISEFGVKLFEEGWVEISHPDSNKSGHYFYVHVESGLKIQYDKAVRGAPGFKGKDHVHIFNPIATGKCDKYLDINGNPVAKNSKASHILFKERKRK